MDLVHGPLTGGHSESDPVHARPVAVAVRTACLLLPVRESKSINNVGTSFAINRINERTIDVLARKRQTITNTITRPSARAGPRGGAGPPRALRDRAEAGAGHVRFGRTVISVAFTPARITHSITVPIDHTNAHMPRPRVDVSLELLTDRPRPRRTAMADVWPSSAAQNHSALKINNRAPLIARPPPPRPSHRALCRDQCD